MLQDTAAAAKLQAMLSSVAQDPLLEIVGGICLQLGLRKDGSRLESQRVTMARIGKSLVADGKRSLFPQRLIEYFSQPTHSRYFNVERPVEGQVAVTLLIGNIITDHSVKLRPASSVSSSSLLLPAQNSQPKA